MPCLRVKDHSIQRKRGIFTSSRAPVKKILSVSSTLFAVVHELIPGRSRHQEFRARRREYAASNRAIKRHFLTELVARTNLAAGEFRCTSPAMKPTDVQFVRGPAERTGVAA